MARKHPVVPIIDQFRLLVFGLEMVNFALGQRFAIGTKVEKHSPKIVAETQPVAVSWSITYALPIILHPPRGVLRLNLGERIRLWASFDPMHYF